MAGAGATTPGTTAPEAGSAPNEGPLEKDLRTPRILRLLPLTAAGDTARSAISGEVQDPRRRMQAMKEVEGGLARIGPVPFAGEVSGGARGNLQRIVRCVHAPLRDCPRLRANGEAQ
ncbi:MAG: hypothetical protein ACREDM_04945 [Methylocella sp.]